MLIEGAMILTWLSAGAAVGSLLTYRLVSGTMNQEREEQLRNSIVENEALSRTNSIYRERIEELENTLFSNDKYLEMANEIERLSADNFKLRARLRDLACLVEAEKKKPLGSGWNGWKNPYWICVVAWNKNSIVRNLLAR